MLIAKLLKEIGLDRGEGKKIGGALYLHKSHLEPVKRVFPKQYDLLKGGGELGDLLETCEFVKVKDESISLIEVDSLLDYEPIITKVHRYDIASRELKVMKYENNNPVYHHVWMMFPSDSSIIDIELSQVRSIWWKSYLGVNKSQSSKIGRLNYWRDFIAGLPTFPDTSGYEAQGITSKGTSINAKKMPAGLTAAASFVSVGDVVLDYGGGRYSNGREFVESMGAYYSGFDPFNASPSDNALAQLLISQDRIDVAVCSNVLNVLSSDELVDGALKLLIGLL